DPNANSGYRNNQAMGISEHFEFLFNVPKSAPQKMGFTDFLYMPDASNPLAGRGLTEGTWGLMRAYQSLQTGKNALKPLPTNPPPKTAPEPAADADAKPWWWSKNCKDVNTPPMITVYAQNTSLTLNSRANITLQNALVYTTTPTATNVTEPLILRARAGDCLQV